MAYLEIRITCAQCLRDLDIDLRNSGQELRVELCSFCHDTDQINAELKEAKDKAYEEGVEDGRDAAGG